MNTISALDARVGALETVASILILSRAVAYKNPNDEINRIFGLSYEIARQRLEASQAGPEQQSAAKVFTAIDRLYDLLARFAVRDADELGK